MSTSHRRFPLLVAGALLLSGCTEAGSGPAAPPASSAAATVDEGSVLVATDVGPEDLAISRLIPEGADVTGSWFGTVGSADVVVLAVAEAGGTALSRDRSLWAWTRRPDLGGWLGHRVVAFPARAGVLGLDGTLADVSGDGSDDALVFALTGGSGACGSWSVFDLTADEGAGRRIFSRDLCDARVDPSQHPVGLAVTASVYRPGDPHCCPSAQRVTTMIYAGRGRWSTVSDEQTPLG